MTAKTPREAFMKALEGGCVFERNGKSQQKSDKPYNDKLVVTPLQYEDFIKAGVSPDRLVVNSMVPMIDERDDLIRELVEALEFYANPQIYKPHPHGLAFDDRDLSFKAKGILAKAKRVLKGGVGE